MNRILVTGAAGSLGGRLVPRLERDGHRVFATDVDLVDVTSSRQVARAVELAGPDLVYHLAAVKYAPEGEDDPELTMRVNAVGTANVIRAAAAHDARVVTASTCKACNPETVYGASKLIAERLTLNAGGWVARFYNVRETAGNVFETWAGLPAGSPIPVTGCQRYFMSADQATDLLVRITGLPPGRYTSDPGEPVRMSMLANDLYPDRPLQPMAPRRGDRLIEPRHAACETLEPAGADGVERVVSSHDGAPWKSITGVPAAGVAA